MAKKRIKAVLAWLLVCSMVLPMFPTVMDAKAAETQVADEYNYADKTVKEILNLDKSLTWVFAGDSITHNATWTGAMNGYSEWFEQYLYDIGRGDDSVVLTAWGGANTYDFQTKENTPNNSSSKYGVYADPGKGIENMVTKYNPDVIFIKLGMNDRAKATANVGKYYKQMLDSIDEQMSASGKKPKIVLLSSTPVSEETWYDGQYHGDTYVDSQQARGSVRRSKIIYEEIANQKGLEFIDLEQAFLEEEVRLGTDYSRIFFYESYSGAPGIHPSAAGQYYIFKTICKELDIYKEDMPIFQLEYEDILSHALYTDETSMESTDTNNYQGSYGNESVDWSTAFTENYVWAVAGAQQMSGYETVVGERSLFRYLDNAMRAGSGDANHRDIRLYNLASPSYTKGMEDINAAYENTMSIRDYNVFMLLPEIPQVYEEGYAHDATLVDAYTTQVRELLEKQECDVKILWTPLASGDADLNENVIAKYAEAIRTIATENNILLFDAYQFMIDKMESNASLATNWFEEGPYISPLCAVDVARAFYTQVAQEGTAQSVLKNHNLRYTSDTQKLKGQYVRDYVEASYTDNGNKTFTVDVSNIAAAYEGQIQNWEFKVLAYKGAGNFNTKNCTLTSINETEYTFNAPCSEFYLAIYGTVGDKIYRFKDLAISVETDAAISEETPIPEKVCLDSLEVVGAPSSIDLVEEQYAYEVPLYQYQTFVKVKATAQAGLTIKVGDEEVVSGGTSMPIKVEEEPISVTVTDGTTTKTWGGVITVEPYWITMDGITVNGESAGKSVTLGMTGSEAKIDNTYYHTFDAAFANATTGDTIELFKDVTIDKTYAVDKNLTITNALGNNVTLTRNVADAMFTVANGATLAIEGDESNTITLDGNKTALTATNSMIVNAGTFTLGTNATLTNGGADSLDYGGALRNTGTAKLQGTISGHTAVNGGAIYNYGAGQITYDGGTYTSNTSIGRGGAMYGTGTSSTTVTNGTFSQNTAQGQYGGGALGIAGNASLTVNGGTFTGNSANNASYDGTSPYGGGAIESNGDLTINGGTFESNTAYNGGAIYLDSSCTATITAGTFGSKDKGNTAENSGGAIYLKKSSSAGAKVTIEGGTFAYNEAAGTTGGGAIAGAALTTVEIKGGTFNHNSATSTTTDTYGGGVIESAGTVAISNGLFESNQALNGGVIYMDAGGELSISAGEFYSNKTLNQADAAGGVIYQNGDGLNITGGTFGAPGKGNISYQRGGAIYVADGDALPEQANITIKNAIFSYNTAQQTNKASGGMMYVGANSFVDIQNCTIDNNETEDTGTANGIYYMGGVMYVTNAKVTVQESQFSYNKAKLGGVVYITGNTSEFTVTDSDFVYNQATGTSSTATNSGWGGVICNNAATVIANSSTFKNNSAWRGGVVYNYTSGQLTLNDCEFGVETEANSVTQYGQDVHAESGSVTLSGKVNLVIDKKGVIIYINEKLKEGSCITIGQLSNYSTVAQFGDENIMNDCKNNAYIVFISKNATLTSSGKVLTYESNKAIMK